MEIHWDKSIDLSARNKEKEAFFKKMRKPLFLMFFLRILYLCYAVFLCNKLLRIYFTGVRVKQSKSGDQLNRLPILITLYPFCKFTVNVV